ncbi:hypothetical protein VCRA2121O157_90149 [Vibrio crassostreae]|nr:hypothetical protein VCRA2113O138_100139 [Vibrio crassostreae]CAK1723393.1 hypothetical protein VCRA2113O140_110138 [Vibrio crassostreae]CAK2223610.1 hypothetical protein VCRA2116O141_110028 [Vibrio crassostreae]CAK2595693.1 hypothetical protein VCRA2113O139_110141 [Vibrio crassostreae]CAK2811283.1 hypothetical protein VCRA2119O149_20018 [Vibrio crassostreae]
MPLRSLQGFIEQSKLRSHLRLKREERYQHLTIDATGLKVYGEDEWKVKNTGWMASVEFSESFIL